MAKKIKGGADLQGSKLVNVADGENPSDGVNKAQLSWVLDVNGNTRFEGGKVGIGYTESLLNTSTPILSVKGKVAAGFGANGAVFIGESAGANVSGNPSGDVAIGKESSPNSGGQNVAIGYQSDKHSTTTYKNVIIGYQAGLNLNVANYNNVIVGWKTGENLTGGYNILLGSNCGQNLTGSNNLFQGYLVGQYASGHFNTFQGNTTGQNVVGNFNIAQGYVAAQYLQGSDNITFGTRSGKAASSLASILIGSSGGEYYQGNFSIVTGYLAGRYSRGNDNILIGKSAGQNNVGGSNILIGTLAGEFAESGNRLHIGGQAGRYAKGSRQVFIGAGAQSSFLSNQTLTFSEIDVNVADNTITVSSHGIPTNTSVALKYTTSGTAIGGLTHNSVVLFFAVDGNTLRPNLLSDGNYQVTMTDGGTGPHHFSIPTDTTDSVVIGANQFASGPNQVWIGANTAAEFNVGQLKFKTDIAPVEGDLIQYQSGQFISTSLSSLGFNNLWEQSAFAISPIDITKKLVVGGASPATGHITAVNGAIVVNQNTNAAEHRFSIWQSDAEAANIGWHQTNRKFIFEVKRGGGGGMVFKTKTASDTTIDAITISKTGTITLAEYDLYNESGPLTIGSGLAWIDPLGELKKTSDSQKIKDFIEIKETITLQAVITDSNTFAPSGTPTSYVSNPSIQIPGYADGWKIISVSLDVDTPPTGAVAFQVQHAKLSTGTSAGLGVGSLAANEYNLTATLDRVVLAGDRFRVSQGEITPVAALMPRGLKLTIILKEQ